MPPQAGESIEQYEARIAARELAALAAARAERERQAGLARDGMFNFAEAQDKDRKAAREVAQNTPGPIRRKKKAANALKRKRKLPTDITDSESEPEGELPDINRPLPPKPTSGWHRKFYPKSSNADPSPCLMRRPIPKKPWLAYPVSVETPKKSKSKKARTAEWVAGSTSTAAAPAGAMIEGAGVLGPVSWSPLPDLFAECESEEEVEENEGEEEKWELWSQESVEV
ncbi:hypothetical protein DFP72DRAFT_1124545 [Ephemerocybe angulata]|uniref:Uncharacterized protein n=1 Tax=Ephemerocybe angulata TaxID=980116 RepID=A0A8H6HX32_9AGAR|nr:hypothetical protein DFP72DRAFT_1124545 [Tulosesus angulatus]